MPNKSKGELIKGEPQDYIGVFAKIIGSRSVKLGEEAEALIVE
jgi:hypothetical protein